jgi:hypothetical protein
MSPIEWKRINPEELASDAENIVRRFREDKYALQQGLKDLDFDIEEEELTRRGFSLPFPSIAQAEQALTFRFIRPRQFWEYDGTVHQVFVFHPQPVGYSGSCTGAWHCQVKLPNGSSRRALQENR